MAPVVLLLLLVVGVISALYHIIFSLSSMSFKLICLQSYESSRVFCERVCMITDLTGVAISSMKYVGEFNLYDTEE